MSAEFWAVIAVGAAVLGVGVGLLTLGWLAFNSLRNHISDVDRRLATIEGQVALLIQGLHIEVSGKGQGTP